MRATILFLVAVIAVMIWVERSNRFSFLDAPIVTTNETVTTP